MDLIARARGLGVALTVLALLAGGAAMAVHDAVPPPQPDLVVAAACDRYVAPGGNNDASGSPSHPWKTMAYAARHVRDDNCTVWFRDGTYKGTQTIERRFDTRTVFRAINPLRAVFVSSDAALDVSDRAGNMTFTGLRFHQTGRAADGVLVYISGSDDGTPAPSHIVLAGNLIHDSYGDDLLKIRSAAHAITVRGNVFYNQAEGEQHIDVNGASAITIEGNIFTNAFAASGRASDRDTKQFIVVKDSNGSDDGYRGSRRIDIARNVFLRWEGGDEGLISIGNDGRSFFEARGVDIENNLVIGNNTQPADAVLNVFGAAGVDYVNNTVVGNFRSDAFAMNVGTKEANPRNRYVRFANNLWADPTGTMQTFSDGSRRETRGLVLRRNLYWNGGRKVPGGDLLSPRRDDPAPVFGNPGVNRDQRHVALPIWNGHAFRSGNRGIRAEFVRLVRRYGRIGSHGAAVDRASEAFAPPVDILGRSRGAAPDLGAFEV